MSVGPGEVEVPVVREPQIGRTEATQAEIPQERPHASQPWAGWYSWRDNMIKGLYIPALHKPLPDPGNVFSDVLGYGKTNLLQTLWFLLGALGFIATAAGGSGAAGCSGAVLLFIPHNSVLTFLFGLAYERAIKYHKMFGSLLLIPLVMHALHEGWGEWGGREITGTAALGAYGALVLLSQNPIRRRFWELFKIPHLILAAVFVVAAIAHGDVVGSLFVPLVLYAADLLLRGRRRFERTKVVRAEQLEGSDITVLEVECPRAASYEAGQYGFIMIPKLSPIEWHPYSSSGYPGASTLTFAMKPMGKSVWSSKALGALQEGDTVRIDGPYGYPEVPFHLYSKVVLVAGGIGCTPMISIARDVIQTVRRGEAYHKVKQLHFNWTVRNPHDLLLAQEEISFMRSFARSDLITFKVDLYVSKAAAGGQELGVEFHEKRMDVSAMLKSYADPDGTRGCLCTPHNNDSAVAVMVCGPAVLADQVERLCNEYSTKSVPMHSHVETFLF